MTPSASSYTAYAVRLRAVATSVSSFEVWATATRSNVTEVIDQLAVAWYGPLPDAHHQQAATYLDAIAPLASSCAFAADAIERWADLADEYAVEVRRYEREIQGLRSLPADPSVDDLIASARDRKADASLRWKQVCGSKAADIAPVITALGQVASTIAVPVDERTVAPGGGYTVVTVALAETADVDLGWIAPGGDLQRAADEALDDFLTHGNSDLMFTVIETADNGDILTTDEILSRSDLQAATDPTTVRKLLLAWGRATDTTLSENDLDVMTATIVASAWMMLGSDSNRWEEVDDRLRREPKLQAVIAERAVHELSSPSGGLLGPEEPAPDDPTERFIWAMGGTELPESAAAAIEAGHLDLYVNGPGLMEPSFIDSWDTPGDWFRNLVFDWEAFYGDDANVANAGLQVLGVLPIGKGARVLRTLRWGDDAGNVGSEFAAFWNLTDEGVAALDAGTAGRHGDGLPPAGVPVGGQSPPFVLSAEHIDDFSGPTAESVVSATLDDTRVFYDLGIEAWSVADTIEAINTPPSQLTPDQQVVLQHLRDEIGLPQPGDILQRVIPMGESELYLSNVTSASTNPMNVGGFVAPAQDVASFTTPAEMVDNLALGYVDEATGALAYSPDAHAIRAIRFPVTTDVLEKVEIPRVSELGGSGAYDNYDWPFTGNGFTSSPDAIVPEVRLTEAVALPNGAEMWEIGADGRERLIGVYQKPEWIRYDG